MLDLIDANVRPQTWGLRTYRTLVEVGHYS